MIRLNEDKIIAGIKGYNPIMQSSLEEELIKILQEADWNGDGTGRGFVADYKHERYYIIMEKPVLVPFNKVYDYTLNITCHMRKQSKYGEDIFEFRIGEGVL